MILDMTKRVLVIDLETSSPVELGKEGQYRYWAHPESRVLMTGAKWLTPWGATESPAGVCDHEAQRQPLSPAIIDAIRAPPGEVMLAAANCEFDRAGLARMGYPTPPEKWLDVLVFAYFLGFAGRLDRVLTQVTPVGYRKNPKGTRCITIFSKQMTPWYENPQLWNEFLGYCVDDAIVEERLLSWCLYWLDTAAFRPMVHRLLRQEQIYRRINRRGLPVDLPAVNGACKLVEREMEVLIEQLRKTTDLENPGSQPQLLSWFNRNRDTISDIRKDTLRDYLAVLTHEGKGNSPDAEVIRLRQEIGKTSTKKYFSLQNATCPDGRFRGAWQFYGASRTGRVAGRVLNAANLVRPKGDPETIIEFFEFGNPDLVRLMYREPVFSLLSYCLRAALKAPEDKRWCVVDLTSIESVGLAWLSGCQTVLDIFFAGRDTYKTMAAITLGIPYEEVTPEQRSFYKPVVLGGGYRLSPYGLTAYAASYGQTLAMEEAETQINSIRENWHEIFHHQDQLLDAAVNAVRNPGREFPVFACDKVLDVQMDSRGRTRRVYSYKTWPRTAYWCDPSKTFLFCLLPSGRCLSYFQPEVKPKSVALADGTQFTIRQALHYKGIDQKAKGQTWREISPHAGHLVENNTQALCRDGIWNSLELIEDDPRFELVGDIYDEALTIVGAEDQDALTQLRAHMTTPAPWMDENFFLGAGGYVSQRFKKD